MNRTNRHRSRWPAALVILALAAASNGDQRAAATSPESGGAGGGSGEQPSGSTIKIGFLVAATGPVATAERFTPNVAEAWEAWVNDEGGINGHPVDVIIKNSKGDPATAISVARDLVESDEVIAVVSMDAAADGTYGPYLEEQGVPVIGAVGYNPAVWGTLTNFFTLSTSIPTIVESQMFAADAVGAEAFGVAACAESASCAQVEPIYPPTAESLGLDYTGLVRVSEAAPNYTAECLQFIDAGTDFIQISAVSDVGLRVAADCRRQGYDGWIGASGGTVIESDWSTDPNLRLAGALNGFPWWVDAEPVEQFRSVMEEYAPDEEYGDANSTGVWAAFELFRKAMAGASDNPTRDEVFAAMYSLQDEDLNGLLPAGVTYTEGEPAPPVPCFWLYRYENGEFSPVEFDSESGNSVTDGPLRSYCYTSDT